MLSQARVPRLLAQPRQQWDRALWGAEVGWGTGLEQLFSVFLCAARFERLLEPVRNGKSLWDGFGVGIFVSVVYLLWTLKGKVCLFKNIYTNIYKNKHIYRYTSINVFIFKNIS